MKSPLEGLIILDMTRFLSGPFCTMLLGNMGELLWGEHTPEFLKNSGFSWDEIRHLISEKTVS